MTFHFQKRKSALPDGVLATVNSTLTAVARYEAPERTVHLRYARHGDKYYVDLGDDRWRVVEVDSAGWRILDVSPVMFERTQGMRALPEPVQGGKFKPLLKVLNIPNDQWIMILAWIIECMRPDTPYVGLELSGPQGSAKSSTQSFLRDLIDPNKVNLRARPSSARDMFVTAKHNHMVGYENLSGFSHEMQDALCTMLTGGGFGGRKLYTTDSENVIETKRPVIVNGINNVVTNPDLLDRFICLALPEIRSENRRSEKDLQAQFEKLKPRVFGAILTRFSKALRHLPDVIEEDIELPRMADFALLGEAVARSLEKRPGHFLRLYRDARAQAVQGAIDNTPLGAAIVSYLSENPEGLDLTYTNAWTTLRSHYETEHGVPTRNWPEPGKEFGNALRRLQPALRQVGIEVEILPRSKHGYGCRITRLPGPARSLAGA